jgi:hypothetical protein
MVFSDFLREDHICANKKFKRMSFQRDRLLPSSFHTDWNRTQHNCEGDIGDPAKPFADLTFHLIVFKDIDQDIRVGGVDGKTGIQRYGYRMNLES